MNSPESTSAIATVVEKPFEWAASAVKNLTNWFGEQMQELLTVNK